MQTALEKFNAIHRAMKRRIFGAPAPPFPGLPPGVPNGPLQCFVYSLDYNFIDKTGNLRMDRGSCTDGKACIDLFQRIDPNVEVIHTWAAGVRDTRYRRIQFEGWVAELDEA